MIDKLRHLFPDFGFASYALAPGGPVTVEIHAPDGSIYAGSGGTEETAWAGLYPDLRDNEEDYFCDEPEPQQPSIFS